MHLFTSKTLSNYKKPQIRGVQEGEGGNGGHGQEFPARQNSLLDVLSDSVLRINVHFLFSFFFENVHNCQCSWLKEYGTYCNNKSILLVSFFFSLFLSLLNKRPNVTEGVRNASPQRLRSLLQPKDFPANHLEPILGSVHSLFFFS